MDTKGVRFDEVMDKYWRSPADARIETCSWYTLQKDYDTVGLLSSARVGQEYAALFQVKTPSIKNTAARCACRRDCQRRAEWQGHRHRAVHQDDEAR